jgi:hypothetical protein
MQQQQQWSAQRVSTQVLQDAGGEETCLPARLSCCPVLRCGPALNPAAGGPVRCWLPTYLPAGCICVCVHMSDRMCLDLLLLTCRCQT